MVLCRGPAIIQILSTSHLQSMSDTRLQRPEIAWPVSLMRSAAVRGPLQKLPSNRLDFDDMEAELGGAFLEQFDLLAAAPVLIILHAFVDVILSVLQHPVH